MPVSTFFTAPTGIDQVGIDLFIDTASGTVTNTRANAVVRHNEVNRFFLIPNQSVVLANAANYLLPFSAQNAGQNKYHILFMQLAARTLAGTGDYAFNVTATPVTSVAWSDINASVIDNTIGLGSSVNNIGNGDYNNAQIGCVVVTSINRGVLDISRASLASGGDGSVPLVGQVSYVVSPGFGFFFVANSILPRFWQTVTTVFSRTFPLTYQAPLHRDLSY